MKISVYSKQLYLVRSFFVFLLILGVSAPYTTFAQTTPLSNESQAQLQADYDALQQEIARWQGILDETKAKASGIKGDISVLTAQINVAESTIKAKNIAIAQLASQINIKKQTLSDLQNKIDQGKESLAQIIRKTNELDAFTLPEVILGDQNLSDFYNDISTFDSVNRSLQIYFTEIQQAQSDTAKAAAELDSQKNAQTDAKYIVQTQEKAVAQSQAEKKQLLAITQTQAAGYQAIVADRQAKAAAIRAALFKLRDAQGIQFSDALAYANAASQKTGVRPALILAILTQESDLGKNQGSCLVTDLNTGNGVGKNSGTPFQRVMKAPNDTVPFQAITTRLGLNWQLQAVSCPTSYTWYPSRGYGGAMGPSQFIPSTWELFKDRIGAMLGIQPDAADPWNPEDAFMATGLYLSDLGAVNGSYTSEYNAACKYYSGSACKPGRKPPNVFYGTSVMAAAETIQSNIDYLNGV
jgi:membrane-bound lytic murein transglycosylase B